VLDSFIRWAGTVDWNSYAEIGISYSYILYYLPFPLLIMSSYFLLKSVSVPSFWLRSLLAVLVAVVFAYFHKQHITVPQGQMDFELIKFVALEYLVGASIGLLGIFIGTIRSIVSSIVKRVKKENTQVA
jgi:uncharacterized membrane protein